MFIQRCCKGPANDHTEASVIVSCASSTAPGVSGIGRRAVGSKMSSPSTSRSGRLLQMKREKDGLASLAKQEGGIMPFLS